MGIGHRRADVDLRGEVEDDVRVGARDNCDQLGSLNIGYTNVNRRECWLL